MFGDFVVVSDISLDAAAAVELLVLELPDVATLTVKPQAANWLHLRHRLVVVCQDCFRTGG